MSEELRFFLAIAVVTLVIFGVITVVEIFVLRAFKRLEAPKNLYYAASANGFGFVITLIITAIIIFLLLAFGASVLGGVGSVMIGSLFGIIISLVMIPILVFAGRFFLFRFFKITETKFRLLYSSISSVAVLLSLIVMWTFVISILSNFS